MVKLKETQHFMHKLQGNYSSCTGRSSENICSNSGGMLCSNIVGMFGTLSLGVFCPGDGTIIAQPATEISCSLFGWFDDNDSAPTTASTSGCSLGRSRILAELCCGGG
jgi:hypothetical protein